MRTKRPYRVVASGVDKLVVNAYGRLLPAVAATLDAAQAQAVAERDAQHTMRAGRSPGNRHREPLVETPYRIAGQPLLCAAHGAGKGQWRWLLRCSAVTLEVGLGRLQGICCRATLSSPFLWRYGPRRAWAYVTLLLDTWAAPETTEQEQRSDEDEEELESVSADEQNVGHEVIHVPLRPLCPRGFRYQVSELHLCADVAGLGVDQLRREAFVHRGVVARWHPRRRNASRYSLERPLRRGGDAHLFADRPALSRHL